MSIVQYIKPLLVSATLLLSQCVAAQRVLTLGEARTLAVARNNNLKAAQQNVAAARTQKAIAAAKGMPALDGSVTGFYFSSPLNKLLPEYGVSPMITASQPLYAGGKIRLGKEAAAKGVEIAEEQQALTTAEVILAAESAYWQVVSSREKIKLAEQYARHLDGLYQELNNAYTAGLTYKNDLLRVKVQQNDNKLSLIRTNDAWTLARLNLAQITGLGDSTDFVIPDSVLGDFNKETLRSSSGEIMGNRPEIRILQRSLEAGRIQEKILKADFRPTIGLSGGGLAGFGKQGINLGNPSSNAFAGYYGLVQLSMPLLDWGQRKQKIKQQQYNITAQQYQLQETKEKISLEVQQAYLQLDESAKRIELSGASLEQAEENLRLSNDRCWNYHWPGCAGGSNYLATGLQ